MIFLKNGIELMLKEFIYCIQTILSWTCNYGCTNSIRLRRNFDRSRIFAGFGKTAGFWPEPEPDSGATLSAMFCYGSIIIMMLTANDCLWCVRRQAQKGLTVRRLVIARSKEPCWSYLTNLTAFNLITTSRLTGASILYPVGAACTQWKIGGF